MLHRDRNEGCVLKHLDESLIQCNLPVVFQNSGLGINNLSKYADSKRAYGFRTKRMLIFFDTLFISLEICIFFLVKLIIFCNILAFSPTLRKILLMEVEPVFAIRQYLTLTFIAGQNGPIEIGDLPYNGRNYGECINSLQAVFSKSECSRNRNFTSSFLCVRLISRSFVVGQTILMSFRFCLLIYEQK